MSKYTKLKKDLSGDYTYYTKTPVIDELLEDLVFKSSCVVGIEIESKETPEEGTLYRVSGYDGVKMIKSRWQDSIKLAIIYFISQIDE